jgi:hypothetical protein
MKFELLWDAHPNITLDFFPCACNGKIHFENQCAIRMGVALSRVNFKKKNKVACFDFEGERCWFHPESDNHTLRVEELVSYLIDKLPKRSLTIRQKEDYPLSFDDFGACGIIAIIDFWGQGDQGDHIDLVDSDGIMTDGTHVDDYLSRARKAYHWEIV